MPIKLIFVIILMVLVAVLTGFNLGNTSDVWFFHTFQDVPVIYTTLGAFLAGVLVTLPFTFGKRREKPEEGAKAKKVSKKEQKKAAKAAQAKGASAASVPAPSAAAEPVTTDAVPPAEGQPQQ